MSIPRLIRLTYEDYAALPDDGKRYEILDGVLYVSPSPRRKHQELAGDLFIELSSWVKRHNLGKVYIAPFDVLLSEHDIVVPDILFIHRDRRSIVDDANVKGAPDLVIEVLSPSNRRVDRVLKLQRYALFDVGYYWMLDPEAQTLEEYAREGEAYVRRTQIDGGGLFRPAIFPDLVLDLGALWPR